MRRVIAFTTLMLAVTVPLGGTDIEREARELEALLIAPCCFSQQVALHQSPAAREVRQDVRRRLTAGETRDQILAAYVAQYGKRVLAQPPAEGIDWLLYILPPFGLALTAGLVGMVVRRFTTRRSAPTAVEVARLPGEERYRDELDEQLRDLD